MGDKPATRFLAHLAVVITLGFITACQRTPPLEHVVNASSDHGLLMWKAEVAGDFNRQEWHDFDAAVQEIKYGVMIRGEASGSAGVWNAALGQIDGLTVRGVLELGLGQKLARVTRERDEFLAYLGHNDQLRVRPDDDASADYLQTLREHQERRVVLLDEQVRATEEILRRRGIAKSAPGGNKPRPASRPF